jgi:hypothetical protein
MAAEKDDYEYVEFVVAPPSLKKATTGRALGEYSPESLTIPCYAKNIASLPHGLKQKESYIFLEIREMGWRMAPEEDECMKEIRAFQGKVLAQSKIRDQVNGTASASNQPKASVAVNRDPYENYYYHQQASPVVIATATAMAEAKPSVAFLPILFRRRREGPAAPLESKRCHSLVEELSQSVDSNSQGEADSSSGEGGESPGEEDCQSAGSWENLENEPR